MLLWILKVKAMTKDIWSNIRIFFEGAVLSYRALFRWLRPSTYIASQVLAPLTMMIFFVYIGAYASGSNNASYYVIGNALIFSASSGIFGVTMSIGGERWTGTLPYLFGAPANRMAMFAGRSLFHILNGMLGVCIGLGWGVLLFGLNLAKTDPLALGFVILVTTFSTASLGLLMGCLSLLTRNVMLVNNTVYFMLLLFSGANLVVETLPKWMQVISLGLPLTRGVTAARLIINGGKLHDVLPLMQIEFLIGIGFALFGYVMFRVFETQAKKLGTLDIF
jgi:ABC-2 type transport system permease protein